MALGLQLVSLSLEDEVLDLETTLSQFDTKAVRAKLSGRQVDYLKAKCLVRLNVQDLRQRPTRHTIVFDDFPRDTVTVNDIKKALAPVCGLPIDSQFLVRQYPCLRPILARDEERVFGFAGIKDRGLWKESPYPGPLHPAGLPTPPDLSLALISEEDHDFLEMEESWISQFQLQSIWSGEMETPGGEKQALSLKISPPHQPGWKRMRGQSRACSTRLLSVIRDEQGKLVAFPDLSEVQGCALPYEAREGCLDSRYLPTPEEINDAGSIYLPFEKGVWFGDGELTFQLSSGQQLHLKGSYRLHLKASGKKHDFTFSSFASRKLDQLEDSSGYFPEYILQGTVDKGMSESHFLKGVYFLKHSSTEVVPEVLMRRFCLFQHTSMGVLPDVVNSPVGRRISGLQHYGFTVFGENEKGETILLEESRTSSKQILVDNVTAMLKDQLPRVVLMDCLVESEGKESRQLVLCLW